MTDPEGSQLRIQRVLNDISRGFSRTDLTDPEVSQGQIQGVLNDRSRGFLVTDPVFSMTDPEGSQ